jgi:hypothetical protein
MKERRLFLTNLAGFFSWQPGRILGQNPFFFSKSCPEKKSCRSGVRNPGRKKFNDTMIFIRFYSIATVVYCLLSFKNSSIKPEKR